MDTTKHCQTVEVGFSRHPANYTIKKCECTPQHHKDNLTIPFLQFLKDCFEIHSLCVYFTDSLLELTILFETLHVPPGSATVFG